MDGQDSDGVWAITAYLYSGIFFLLSLPLRPVQ